ncbi:MAG: hypothetical protein AAF490_02250 [Chloroflexota bacterium]
MPLKIQNKRLRLSVIITLLAIPITFIFTYPLLPQIGSHIVGYFGSDAINHAWSVWWFKHAVTTLQQSPAELNYIYYPAEVEHPLVLATAWVKLVGFIFVERIDPITLYNIHLFLSYPLTWVITALLCYELTENETSAVIGGAIFTFTMHRTIHALYGHFTHALAYSYPLLALSLFLHLKRPSPKRGLLLIASLFIILTTDLMAVAFFAIPVITGMVLFQWKKQHFLKTLWPFVVAFFLVLPFVWPLIVANLGGGLGWYGSSGVGEFSADAVGLFVPPPDHLLSRAFPPLKDLSNQIYWLGRTENIVYAGWITLALAVLALIKNRQNRWVGFWFVITAVTTLFSYGPLLRVAGRFINIQETPIIMPYAILLQLPFLSWGRTPARLHLTAMLGLAILAAYGINWLLQRYQWVSQHKIAFGFGLVMLILLDSVGPYPWPMTDTAVPAGLTLIAEDDRQTAVLDLPVSEYTAAKYHLLYQLEHGHPLVGGFRVRLPESALEEMLLIESYALQDNNQMLLAEAGIGYIILHKQFLSDTNELEAHFRATIGNPIFDDEQITLFAITAPRELAPHPIYSFDLK